MVPTSPRLLSCLALGAALALSGCGTAGYHRIGDPVVEPMLPPSAPLRATPAYPLPAVQGERLLPLASAAVQRYARRLDGVSVGETTLTIGSGTLKLRVAATGSAQPLELSGSVRTGQGGVEIDLPALAAVPTLQGFSLPASLQPGRRWEARGGGEAWSYRVHGRLRVRVPAGEFDCWVLKGETGRSFEQGWRRSTQTLYMAEGVGLVKLEQTVATATGRSTFERALVEELVAVEGPAR